ncbi:MAG: rubrerythrin family protein [Oscillospiraceae bacterium]|nr:rubrerythrin family protein [Oscillospiraceae bacterium]
MSVDFTQSKTRENLMRAFAGESQARNRYTFAASFAKKNQLHVIESVFLFTAEQERSHAKVFYDQLKPFSGSEIQVDGSYPVSLFETVSDYLRDAEKNEAHEFQDAYPGFGRIAREEGFESIARIFEQIADVENTHSIRFRQLAELVEQNKLFVADAQVQWMCLNCGHIENAVAAPETCPVCQHPKGYFVRLELAPWTQE